MRLTHVLQEPKLVCLPVHLQHQVLAAAASNAQVQAAILLKHACGWYNWGMLS